MVPLHPRLSIPVGLPGGCACRGLGNAKLRPLGTAEEGQKPPWPPHREMSCLSPVFQVSSPPRDPWAPPLGWSSWFLQAAQAAAGGWMGTAGDGRIWGRNKVGTPCVSCPLAVLGSIVTVTGQWGHPNLRVAKVSHRQSQKAGLLVLVQGEKGESSCGARHSRGPLRHAHQPLNEDQPPLPHHGWCLPSGESASC